MRKIWLLGAAMLCACQQNRPESPLPARAAQPAASERQADERPVIACFGDSLTAGLGLDPGQSYPDVLQQELDRRGYRYRVANFGVSGDTTQDGLARLPMVLAEKPAIVVLEFGANDGLRGQPVANTSANLARMIEELQHGGAKVVLAGMTLPPNYGADYIRGFEATFKELARRFHLTLIPFFLEGVATHTEFMQRDGLHPTAAGARMVAATVLKSIEPLLRK
jgi:acyl-CoA thioesterase-1